ncbi:PucR family transcriptional regulator [Vagococcus fluvialis]|uniref:PucR family transcriptional regulator n=1 Tax=Vagococcus fluvialis TaxID=2738 RepID=UPI003D102618
MSISLKKLLTLPSLSEAKLITGDINSQIEISNVMVLEAPDVKHWAKKGQLLLSSLYTIQNFSEAEQINFIKELHDIKVSGLIIKINRFIDYIPKGILEGADLMQFPIIQIPDSVSYESVMIEVMQHLFNQKVALLDHYRNVHLEMMTLALNPEQAGLSNSISKLHELVNKPISLIIGEEHLITNESYRTFDVVKLIENNKSDFNFEYNRQLVTYPMSRFSFPTTQLVIPIDTDSHKKCFLIIHELDKKVNEMDLMVIENSTLIIKLEVLKENSIKQAKMNLINDVFDDLIYGKFNSSDELSELINFLKMDSKLRYRVVVWRFDTDTTNTQVLTQTNELSVGNQLMSYIRKSYPSVTYRVRNNRILFLISHKELPTTKLPKFIQTLETIYEQHFDDNVLFQVGISEESSLEQLHYEAKKALQIIQQGELFIGNHFALTFEDLGLYRIFSHLMEDASYNDYIPTSLKIIVENYPLWLETLKLFFDFNQSYTKVADVLFIHKKTVHYRIEKMVQLAEIDLNNPEEILQLQIGLRLLLIKSQHN